MRKDWNGSLAEYDYHHDPNSPINAKTYHGNLSLFVAYFDDQDNHYEKVIRLKDVEFDYYGDISDVIDDHIEELILPEVLDNLPFFNELDYWHKVNY